MKRKHFQTICGIVCVLGLMLMVGTEGAGKFEQISLERMIVQSVIGLAMFAGGAYWGGFMQ